MMTMNEKDKNEMLGAILAEGETYQCKLWGTIMAVFGRTGGED